MDSSNYNLFCLQISLLCIKDGDTVLIFDYRSRNHTQSRSQ